MKERQTNHWHTTRFCAYKQGSYVDPDEEHQTANLFVGNLAPTLIEAAIIELSSQFGDLISLKSCGPERRKSESRIECQALSAPILTIDAMPKLP